MVVVQYNQAPGPLDLLSITNLLGTILNKLPLVNGIVADLPLANILSLSNQANVKYISLDRPMTPTPEQCCARGERFCRVAIGLHRARASESHWSTVA